MTDAQQMREAAARASYERGSALAESVDWSDLQPSNLTHEFAIKKHRAIADAVARVVLEEAAKVADAEAKAFHEDGDEYDAALIAPTHEAVAAAIRALAPPETEGGS